MELTSSMIEEAMHAEQITDKPSPNKAETGPSQKKLKAMATTESTIIDYLEDHLHYEKVEHQLLNSTLNVIKKRDEQNSDILILSDFDGVPLLDKVRLSLISHRRIADRKKVQDLTVILKELEKSIDALTIVLRELAKKLPA